jgi:hypothetical protein
MGAPNIFHLNRDHSLRDRIFSKLIPNLKCSLIYVLPERRGAESITIYAYF